MNCNKLVILRWLLLTHVTFQMLVKFKHFKREKQINQYYESLNKMFGYVIVTLAHKRSNDIFCHIVQLCRAQFFIDTALDTAL